jgi:GNAT superfamily N-acetyltransferase
LNAGADKLAAAPRRLRIALEPKPWRAVKKEIGDGLDAYNVAASGGRPNESQFIVTARTSRGALAGGFYCTLYFETCFLKWAWVDETARGGGTGRLLLEACEREARARGAAVLYLDTFSFQARPFYEKCGYKVFGTLKLGRKGMARYWMRKTL